MANVVGRTDEDLPWGPGHAARIRADDHGGMDGGLPEFNLERAIPRRDGTTRWFREDRMPLLRPDGTTSGILVAYADITSLKRTEDSLARHMVELKASEQRLRATVESAELGLYESDLPTGEDLLGAGWCRLLGLPATDTRSTIAAYQERVHPDDVKRVGTGTWETVMVISAVFLDDVNDVFDRRSFAKFDRNGRFLFRRAGGFQQRVCVRRIGISPFGQLRQPSFAGQVNQRNRAFQQRADVLIRAANQWSRAFRIRCRSRAFAVGDDNSFAVFADSDRSRIPAGRNESLHLALVRLGDVDHRDAVVVGVGHVKGLSVRRDAQGVRRAPFGRQGEEAGRDRLGVEKEPTAPAIPKLLSPGNDTIGVPILSSLWWDPPAGATGYRVQLSTVSDFSTTVLDEPSVNPTISFANLAYQPKHWWRVQAVNDAGLSRWSLPWSFTTIAAPSGVDGADNAGVRLQATQVPGGTVLRYQLPISGRATLQVFNLLGQPVATLADAELETGSHQRSITPLPAGTYWCRLAVGDIVVVKSVVVP